MQNVETSALKTLRSGFLYLFIALAMSVVFVASLPAVLIYVSSLAGMIIMIVFVTALLLAIVVLTLCAIFGKIRPGMRQLSEVDNGFRICYTGTTLMLVGLAMLAFGVGIGMMVGISTAMTFVEIENIILVALALGGGFTSAT